MTPDLQATLEKLPDRPGVYLMRDATDRIVYIGKATDRAAVPSNRLSRI